MTFQMAPLLAASDRTERILCMRNRTYPCMKTSGNPPEWRVGTLVENERLVTKKMTKIRISMTTFGLAITGG